MIELRSPPTKPCKAVSASGCCSIEFTAGIFSSLLSCSLFSSSSTLLCAVVFVMESVLLEISKEGRIEESGA